MIRKGKVHKPTEFGRLVRIDQVENGIVSNFSVADGKPGDSRQWKTALKGHQGRFGRAPEMATGDRGFYSAANEETAREMGVNRVALPARGKLSQRRGAHQKQRWFRRAVGWSVIANNLVMIARFQRWRARKRATA